MHISSVAGKDRSQIAAGRQELMKEFEMKYLGELKHFLGACIVRNNDGGGIDRSRW